MLDRHARRLSQFLHLLSTSTNIAKVDKNWGKKRKERKVMAKEWRK
jgi:hypothetical protein